MPVSSRSPRPFLGIYFARCQVYGRLYRDRAGRYYEGCCPRCGTPYQVRIGAGGTPQRFFKAWCG